MTNTQFPPAFWAIMSLFATARHSPSFKHFSRSAGVSLFSFTVWICTLPISIGTGPCLAALAPGFNVSLEGLIRLHSFCVAHCVGKFGVFVGAQFFPDVTLEAAGITINLFVLADIRNI